MEKWRDDELICLVEKKNERMENEVGINFTIMSPLNKIKKSHIFLLKKLCMDASIFFF